MYWVLYMPQQQLLTTDRTLLICDVRTWVCAIHHVARLVAGEPTNHTYDRATHMHQATEVSFRSEAAFGCLLGELSPPKLAIYKFGLALK